MVKELILKVKEKVNYLKEVIKEKLKTSFIFLLKFVKSSFIKIYNKITCLKPKSLAPINNIKNSSLIMLSKAIRNRRNLNIALSGKYGAGKSSVIKSLYSGIKGFFRRVFYKPIYVSLGLIGLNEKIEDKEVNEFCQEIEKGIIQQIIYKENSIKFPDSQIRRPSKVPFVFKLKTFFIIVFVICLYIANKIYKYDFESGYNVIKDFFIKEETITPGKIVAALVLIIVLWFIVDIIIKFVKFIDNLGVKFRYGQAEIEVSKRKGESLINKYMDELIYFFSKTWYRVVVFEDLDRFLENEQLRPKIIVIFQKLKELNQILNESKQILGKVRFIYVIRDDLFENSQDRTKFFDVIVPVIPVISNYNSHSELRNVFGKYEEIPDKFLQDISPYVLERRQITSLENEYKLYKEEIFGQEIEGKKQLAIVALKTLRPKDFEQLNNNYGRLYDLLNKKKELIQKASKEIQSRINENNKTISEVEAESLTNVQELKKVALYDLKAMRYQYTGETGIRESEFLSDEYGIDKIKDSTIRISSSSYGYIYDEDQLFRGFGGKEEFIKRLEEVKIIEEEKIAEIISNNKELENQIAQIKSFSLSRLLRLIPKIEENLNDAFLENMVLKGYIDENYRDYMYKFITSDKFTKNDQEFMSKIRQNSSSDYDYKIDNVRNVIDELDKDYFLDTNVLNYYLVKQILEDTDTLIEEKKNRILNILVLNDKEIQEFICGFHDFFSGDYSIIRLLLLKINEQNDSAVLNLLKNNFAYERDFIKAIISDKSLILLENLKIRQYIKSYIEEKVSDLEEWIGIPNNEIKNALLKLYVKLKNARINYNDEFAEFIINNKLFEPTKMILTQIFDCYEISTENFNTKILSTIENDVKLITVKDVVYDNQEVFLNECYFSQEKNNNDFKDIENCIKNWNLSNKTIEKIVETLPQNIQDVNIFDISVLKIALKYHKINPTWENYIKIYQKEDNVLTTAMINDIEYNVDKLEKNVDEQLLKESEELFYDIAINHEIDLEVYKKIFSKTRNVYIKDIEAAEFEKERLDVLIDYNKIVLSNGNLMVIQTYSPSRIGKYIFYNLKEFKNSISSFDLTEEIVAEIVTTVYINYFEKVKIVNQINIDLLNNDSLSYLAKNYKSYKNNNELLSEVKNRIISSKISNVIRVSFINKLELNKEGMEEVLNLLGEPYCYIDKYDDFPTVSLRNVEYNRQLIKKLKKLGFIFTPKERSKKIVIFNKKKK